jgi:hypothetical protein
MIMGSKKSPDPVKHLPAAHFSPSAEQMPVIAADADRLALVLRFHYGVKDYKHISERVSRFAWEGDFLNPALGGYPTAAGDKRPVPGFTMLDVINALRFEAKPTAAMPYGSTAFNQYYGINAGAWGRGLSDRYGDYSAQDVIIESDKTLKVLRHWGIPWEDFMNNDPPAKLAAGLAKHPLVVMCNKVNSAHGYYPNLKYYQMCGMRAEATGSTKGISFPAQLAAMISGQYGYGAESRAVIRARELLNLFMAFVTFDLKKAAQSGSMKDAAAIKPWLFGPEGNYKNLPVRLRVVGTKTVREDKLVYSYQAEAFGTETLNYFAITNPEDGYSAKRWSNHANTTYGDDPSRISGDLLAMDVNAIRELAFIRLLSAFSYLHMKASRIGDKLPAEVLTYRRLERSADGALVDNPVFGMYDPIAELNIKAGDKFKEFSIPVNPRIRRVRPSKKTIGVNVQAPLDAYTGVDSGVKNIKQMLDVTDGVHVPTWNSLSNEVWQRHEIQRAVKKRVLVLMQDARAKNTAIRLADTMQLDKTVIGSMMQMNRQARERLMTSGTLLREVTSYPTDCITNTATYKGKLVRGQVGVTPGGKALCCPSLTYSGNLAVCGKGKLACHADCITQSSYPASGTMMTWEDHQRNVLGTPEAKIALEKARAAAALAAAKKKSGAAAGDSTGAGGAGTISLIVGALVLSKLLK